ncbi:MAG: acyltransferase family protein [Steroidobacteraceae bacterium]
MSAQSPATAATPAKLGFNVALNGYRGLCAMLIYGFHLGSAHVVARPSGTAIADAVTYFWTSFAYGVEMFFMISGFVILGSLERHATVGGFLRDRFVRIFSAWTPSLIVVAAVCIVFQMKAFAGAGPVQELGIFIGNLFLIPPLIDLPMVNPASWSLTYEWAFYLTAAAMALALRRATARRLALALWIAFAALFIVVYPRAVFFLVGALVYRYRDWFVEHRRWLRFPAVSFIAFLLLWRGTGIEKAEIDITLGTLVANGRWLFMVAAFVAALHMFASVCFSADGQSGFLKSRIAQFLGNISYSFYLWHALGMAFVKRAVAIYVVPDFGLAAGYVLFAVVSLAIGLAVGWASWQLFEVRLAKLMRRWFTPRPTLGGAVHASH